MHIKHERVVLDACCLINIHASGYFRQIAEAAPVQLVVTKVVWEEEALTLRQIEENSDDDIVGTEQIIEIVPLSDMETETFVTYAAILGDDGEAASCALAFSKKWGIATDDRAAIRFCTTNAPNIQIVTTLELVKHWSEEHKPTASDVSKALEHIRNKARYAPSPTHSLYDWWNRAISQ